MRAIVKSTPEPGSVGLREVPAPVPGPGQVLIDVAAAAVCGTDRAAVTAPDSWLVPRILGHEASGVVAALGPDLDRDDLAVGDRVVVETDAVLCGRCAWCRREEYNRCPDRRGIGTTADGALADRLVMPARALHHLPDGVSLLAGALVEPLAIAVHAVIERSPALAGEVVVVVGPGAVGLLCAQVARAVGATVVLVGRARHAAKLAAARELGITHTVDADATDLVGYVGALTGGLGAHTVFECSGAADQVTAVLPALSKGGRLVMVAFYHASPALDLDLVVNRELEVIGSRGKRPSSFRTGLRLVADGQVRLEPLVGATLPLEEWSRGFELVASGVKVVFDVSGRAAHT